MQIAEAGMINKSIHEGEGHRLAPLPAPAGRHAWSRTWWCFRPRATRLTRAILLIAAACLCVPGILPARSSDEALAHFGEGLKLFDLQRYSEASKEFQLALQIKPKLYEARYHLAEAYFHRRQFAQAREEFKKLETAGFKKDWVGYYLGRMDLAEGNIDSAIARFESLNNSAPLQDELYYLGAAYLRKGQPAKAIELLARQVSLNPRDFRAHDHLGRSYVKLGNSQEAEREFAESRRLRAYYSEGKKGLADCHSLLRQGQTDEAWKVCGAGLETDDIDKLVALGMLFGEFNSLEHALQLFDKARILDPESPEINYDLGLTHFRRKDYVNARRYLQVAVQSRPDFFESLALYGTVLFLLREDSTALEALRHAHQLRPDDAAVSRLINELQSAH